MAPNRLVALLTPLLFAPLAGAVSAWLAKHVPGAKIDQDQLQEIFIGGALIALAPAAQWLHGWQKYEARQAEHEDEVELASIRSGVASPPAEEPLIEEPLPDELAGYDDGFDDVADYDDGADADDALFADEPLAPAQG
jgi:hypothetical protein